METLQISKSNALTAYKRADQSGKTLLENLFGKETIAQKVTDRVKTFEDACLEVGEVSTSDRFSQGSPDDNAYQKLKVIVRALNEGWKPNWDNSSQYKWYPWFYLNSAGFRFDGSLYGYSASHSSGGSRLCFSSEALATYAGKKFEYIYKDLLA